MAKNETRGLNMAGIWWMPNGDNDTLGTLRWIPNVGCVLELVEDSHEFSWDESPGIVWGLNSEQDPITLVGCRYTGLGTIKSRGNATSFGHRVAATFALIGGLFENEADAALTDLYAGYAGLDEYVIEKYYDLEHTQDSEGRYRHGPITFSIPTYDMAKIGEATVGLYVGFSLDNELRLQHKLHISFPESNLYESDGENFNLIHFVLPAFLSAMMGHQNFLTSLSSPIDKAPVEIFDGYHDSMSWDGNSRFQDRLVLGKEKTLALWSTILPAWVENYHAISKLCSAYVKILSDENDGFFNRNNLVHVFFGLEQYHKAKCNLKSGSLSKALEFAISKTSNYFQNVEKYVTVAQEIDVNTVSHARQVLVHANEGEPDYPLVYQQLIFITRCVLLMEMEYPVSSVRDDTSHWDLWHFFADRGKSDDTAN